MNAAKPKCKLKNTFSLKLVLKYWTICMCLCPLVCLCDNVLPFISDSIMAS